MDIGFAKAGFRPIWTNEIDPAAAETHDSVFKQLSQDEGLPHLAGSLPEVSLGSIDAPGVELPARGAADLVIGGPPAKGFSVAGQMRPMIRARSTSFDSCRWWIISALEPS